jgi:catechol 2,3-dioxygenase-like lactoylglutathione lyase family enzyme
MGLAVSNLANSIEFYSQLLGQEPTKTRPGYAKFEVADPPVNLSLNEVRGAIGPNHPVAHFGIQVKSSDAVNAAKERLSAAGVPMKVEENVTCCYAVQDKIWVTDPDGNKWEVYVVLDNDGGQHASTTNACCSEIESCCDEDSRSSSQLTPAGCCQ